MQLKTKSQYRILITFILLVLNNTISSGQKSSKTDTTVHKVLKDQLFQQDQGMQLFQNNKLDDANAFFSGQIDKNNQDKEAYFKRGVVNWELKDTMSACRDWSSVLALGDTATYRLLESKCHSSLVIEDEVIPSKEYKKLFAAELTGKKDNEQSTAKTVVEEMPVFPGGDMALVKYMNDNLQYPAASKQKKIQGRVIVNFIISSKGNVLFPYVVRGLDEACNSEAIRLVKNMPEWKPGKQKGKATMVRYNLPVKFALK